MLTDEKTDIHSGSQCVVCVRDKFTAGLTQKNIYPTYLALTVFDFSLERQILIKIKQTYATFQILSASVSVLLSLLI